ncbi:MAG TPA: lytic transglycosylase domain-containing protein [Candidatus Competibacteraceae bacterium]|nr:lytic transglycosylase domain-containing protein [Candidatus Competibacteraceae bacterium]
MPAILSLLLTPTAEAQSAPAPISSFAEMLRPPHPINEAGRRRYTPHIERIARSQRIDPALIHAVISAESGYDTHAVSPKGAMGLMQILPETAAELGLADPFEPLANIEAGVRHLKRLMRRYPNIQIALAAYNAGEGAVERRTRTIPPYPETQRYVVRVLHFYMVYRRQGAGF